MSLDVYLNRKRRVSYDEGETYVDDLEQVYNSNITHNLGEMAEQAGIYNALWRPCKTKPNYNIPEDNYEAFLKFESAEMVTASEIIPIIEKGLADLKEKPDYFKQFNSENGWGKYQDFIRFVDEYLEACKEYPDAIVEVSR